MHDVGGTPSIGRHFVSAFLVMPGLIRYAELKVQMANMKAEQDGATADLHDQWP